jgi:hypothetical protein
MKRLLLPLFAMLFVPAGLVAQNKHNLYADVGINNFGASVTYDYQVREHIGVGGGLQIHNSNYNDFNLRYSAFVDVRPTLEIGRNLLFGFGDFGITKFGGRKLPSSKGHIDNTDIYFAVGGGYALQIFGNDMGPYITAAVRTSRMRYHWNNPLAPPDEHDYAKFNVSMVMSLGFKF